MTELQRIANDIRDRLLENDAVRRLGVELLWAAGDTDTITIRARHRDRVLTVERGGPWHQRPPERQAEEIAHELVGLALDTVRPAPPRQRAPDHRQDTARPGPGPGSCPAVRPATLF
jgi:hypothetical protein